MMNHSYAWFIPNESNDSSDVSKILLGDNIRQGVAQLTQKHFPAK